MKRLVLLLTALGAITSAQAQINITGAGFSYSQDFNSLDTASGYTNSSANLPTGWSIFEVGSSVNTVNNMYQGGDGSSNTGDTYSFGTVGTTERALGSIASGSNSASYGAYFANTSSDTITKVLLSYTLEQWRGGGNRAVPDTSYFYYSTTATGVDDTMASWTAASQFDLISIQNPSSASALDGNNAANNMQVNDSIIVAIAPGSHLVIKWADKNTQGSDDGLAVDDLTAFFKNDTTLNPNSVAVVRNSSLPLTVLGAASANQLTVGFTATEAGNYSLEVYDVTGRMLHSESINAAAGTQRYTLNNLNLSSGLYIVKLHNNTYSGVTKAVIR